MSSSCHKASLPDTQDGNWIQAAPLPNYPRGFASSFVVGDRAYVGGGYNEKIGGLGRLKDWWSFSVDSGWRQEADFPGRARSNAASFALGGYGYVGTGTDDGNHLLKDFYRYDPVAAKWDSMAEYPGDARLDAVGFAVQGKGYIGTGMGNYWLNDFYQYIPADNRWERTAGTAGNFSKRTAAVAFVYQDRAYIVTGQGSGAPAKDFWQFDPSKESPWTNLPDIANTSLSTADDSYASIQRSSATAWVNDGKAYVTLGQNGSSINTTWMYDFDAQVWKQRTGFEHNSRIGAVAFVLKGRAFVGTGSTGTSNATYDDFEEFIANQPYNVND